ncbi:hypothetical protein PIROE2DRAFT_4133 [Piromyces sp. E2]|nr:hypothetical protein PIROE2DRAFT_4133 [Piromyces sp. E2]|eukprot:OUM68253.1 hypothetical protein PIROE2DRAFT_4133 [Piromyces sp. E2]
MEELYTEIFDPNNIIRYKFPQSLPNHIKPIRDSFNLLLKSLSFKILGGGYDKLFNMMVMSLKYHLVNCKNSKNILNMTEIHLESMIKYVQNPYTGIKIKQLKQRITMEYSNLPNMSFLMIRHDILKLLSGKKKKVRVLMNLNRQDKNGNIKKNNKYILLNNDQIKEDEDELNNEFLKKKIEEKYVINYRYYNQYGNLVKKNYDICKDFIINPFTSQDNINDSKDENKNKAKIKSSRMAINELNELRDLICLKSLEELDYDEKESSQVCMNTSLTNIITEEEEIEHEKESPNNEDVDINNQFNKSLTIDNSNNDISLLEKVKPKKIKPKPLQTDIQRNEPQNDDNVLLTSPLYRKRMESLNSLIPNNNNDNNLPIKSSKASVPIFNINIKDLKNKFESTQSQKISKEVEGQSKEASIENIDHPNNIDNNYKDYLYNNNNDDDIDNNNNNNYSIIFKLTYMSVN